MAQTLTITDGTTTVDILTGDMTVEAWETETATDRVWETLKLSGVATDAEVRTVCDNLDTLFEQARRYAADPNNNDPVWFQWNSDGETAKRALVYDGKTKIRTDGATSALLGVGYAYVDIAVQRHPAYEPSSGTTVSTTLKSTLGGTWSPGNDAGSMAQRISKLLFTSSTLAYIYKMWVGIRETRKGTAGFIAVWEAETGTNFTDAADAADATASSGNKVTVSFATNTAMVQRIGIRWGQIAGANYDDLIGKYLVLGRLKLDALTTELAVQLRHGWAGIAGHEDIVGTTYLSAVDDSSLVNWNLVELGYVSIPPTGNRDGAAESDIQNYHMQVYAERLSVAGSLDIDCLVLVPAEHLVTISGAAMNSGGGEVHVYTGPDDEQYALAKNSGGQFANVECGFTQWNYPVGAGLVVIAAQESDRHSLSMTVNPTLTLYPRWRGFRV